MDDTDDELEDLLLILLIRRYTKKTYLKKQKRQFSFGQIFRKRNEHSLYHNPVQELRHGDREFYFKKEFLNFEFQVIKRVKFGHSHKNCVYVTMVW